MRIPFLLIFFTLLSALKGIAQTRTITGKIISSELYPLPASNVFSADSTIKVTADLEGKFSILIPDINTKIIVGSVGHEWQTLDLPDNCNHLEIVLLRSAHYDFMSAGKVDRLRKKEFDNLPYIHKSANIKGIFESATPCYKQSFSPIKKRLRQYKRERKDYRKG